MTIDKSVNGQYYQTATEIWYSNPVISAMPAASRHAILATKPATAAG